MGKDGVRSGKVGRAGRLKKVGFLPRKEWLEVFGQQHGAEGVNFESFEGVVGGNLGG